MLLRWLVGNYLRQSAESAVQGVLRSAARSGNAAAYVVIPEHFRTAVVFSLGVESSGMRALLEEPAAARFAHSTEHWGPLDGRHVRVVEGGAAGPERAAQATTELIARCRPTWIVSAGFSAALRDDMRHGDIVMADRVLDADGGELQVPFHVPESVVAALPRLHVGALITLPQVLASPDERREIASRFPALAADQETMAVARICQHERIKFMSVRVITDRVDEVLPPEIEGWLKQKSFAAKLGVAAAAVFRRPEGVKDLWHLREAAGRASQHLAGFLRGVLPQLPEDERAS